jgi:hypothetical protein
MKMALFLLLFCISTVVYAEVITGWVSEENCKEQHTQPGGKDCVKKCLRGGAHIGHPEWTPQKMVFIAESDQKIWTVENSEPLKTYAGERIQLSAKLNSALNTLEALEVVPYRKPVSFPLFRFRNGFWINLHHFLRGSARRELHPESKSGVNLVVELNVQEKKDWQEVLEYYKINFAEKHLLFDRELWPIKNWLGDSGNNPDLQSSGHEELANILKKAAPIYRKHWWPEHQRSNQEWIDVAQRLLDQFGSGISGPIEAFYEGLSDEFIVDVTVEAGREGAYTTDNPVRITISSTNSDLQDYAALEGLFHEASHSRDQWLSDKLDAAAAKVKQQLPDRFWHAVLFYTAGEFARKEFEDVGIRNYIPYAEKNKLYEGNWIKCAIQKRWKSHMDDSQWENLVAELKECGTAN